MITSDRLPGRQGRLVLAPKDANGDAVNLDDNAFTVTKPSGDGSFEYNPVGNQLVFRRGTEGTTTSYHVEVDGQPGSGTSFLPLDIEENAVAAPSPGAVALDETASDEAEGTPA